MGDMSVPPVSGKGSFSEGSNPAQDDMVKIIDNLQTVANLLDTDPPSKPDIMNQLSNIDGPLSDLKAQAKSNPKLQEAVAFFSATMDNLNQTVASADLGSLTGQLDVGRAFKGVIDTGTDLAQLLGVNPNP